MKRFIGFYTVLLGTILPQVAIGQIVPDGTLPSDVATPDNLNFTITAGSRVGDNLFHSFSEFSIPTSGSATFVNAADVHNIFSRVTGDSISQIDGLLEAQGTANLFLLNPNGIIFGENATLNIGGSFVGSTADRVTFADGTTFGIEQTGNSAPLLTVSVPVGLQFGENPGAIVQRSQANPDPNPIRGGLPRGLDISPEQTLALVGGDLHLEGGSITAPGGRVELGSVGENATVALQMGDTVTFDYRETNSFNNITFSGGANIDVSDLSGLLGSGDVRIRGRNVTLRDGSQVSSFTIGEISSGSIEVMATETVELSSEGIRTGLPVPTALTTSTISNGQAGNIAITSRRLVVRDGAGIFSNSVALPMLPSRGEAGNITVSASDRIEISGNSANLGNSSINVTTLTEGNAGTIQVTTPQLILRDGGSIEADTRSIGDGGTIRVTVDDLEVFGGFENNGEFDSSRISATSSGPGNAGNLIVTAETIDVRDRGEISTSGISTGAAGNLEITAGKLRLENDGSLRSETLAGRGNINIDTDTVQLRLASITTDARGSASGGNITITTETIAAVENSDIIARAVEGSGGNILITTEGIFIAPDSSISASSTFGVDGVVEIRNPDVDPSSGLVDLSTGFFDRNNTITDACVQYADSEFIITGRGGIPERPHELLEMQMVLEDLGEYVAEGDTLNPDIESDRAPVSSALTEARTIHLNSNGKVELVATARGDPWYEPVNCETIE